MVRVSVSTDVLAGEFSGHRAHLVAVAYRLTGSVADAEDAVQESWLRLSTMDGSAVAGIRDLRAWLTTVVGRICLDRLTSAAARRERYVGPWLPEPLVTREQADDPADQVVRDEGVRMAAMVVLDQLTADQRVAFVLHDAFAVPFDEIAGILGCSAAAARQHASRARRALADADPPPRLPLAEQRAVVERFLTAIATGDTAGVVELLHPDVVMIGDSDGKARTTRRVLTGAAPITRFFFGLLAHYGVEKLAAGELVLVNGDLGMLIPEQPATDGSNWAVSRRVSTFAIRDGRITAIYDVCNPDKLAHLPA